MKNPKHILGLDVGEKRIGVALANSDLKLTKLLDTLDYQDDKFWENLKSIVVQNHIDEIVLGLPRGLEGQETEQTKFVRSFAESLQKRLTLPFYWQDEALTSVRSHEILGKSGKPYKKSDVDAISASLILSDYLDNRGAEE